MSSRGLEVIDSTVQKTYEWINELRDRLDWASDHDALRLLRVTLHQIRDRMHVNETAQLSAQLPLLVRGMFFEGWQPKKTPVKARHWAQFMAVVEEQVGEVLDYRGRGDVIAVFKVINARVTRGEVEDVRACLPAELRDFWPAP